MNGPQAAFWHLYAKVKVTGAVVAARKPPIYWPEKFFNDAKSRQFAAGHPSRLSVISEPPTFYVLASRPCPASGFMKIPLGPHIRTQL